MIDHLAIPVSDYAASKAFYERILAPLGIGLIMEVTPEQTGDGHACGFGTERKPFFWIGSSDAIGRTHVAFLAADHAAVDTFHRNAVAAGARDNGAPGPRPHYHEHYYGAFVLDPDGHNIEAVCHAPAA
ncbi:MAG: VOC family protein [Dokdonella sp.]